MSNLFTSELSFLPWVSFIAGLGGSLHCVGMCGGLVTATCNKSSDVVRYQFGRLLGYLALGLFAGILGKIFTIQANNPKMTLVPGLILGGLFLFWGIQNYRGKRAELPMPKFIGSFLNNIYTRLFGVLVAGNKNFTKSFFVGLLSILLPCGLLYGVVLGVAAFEHSFHALFTMLFFWLGTLPAMVLAPSIIQKFLRPLKLKLPKTYAISLILIGLLTISFRVVRFQEVHSQITPKMKVNCH